MVGLAGEQGKNRDIGYCKPPRATRFKKGRSGNPAGRPKGSGSLTSALREILSPDDAAAIVRRLISLARKGNFNAIRIILDRIDGKVSDRIAYDGPQKIILRTNLPGLATDRGVADKGQGE